MVVSTTGKRLFINLSLFFISALLLTLIWMSPSDKEVPQPNDQINTEDIVQLRIQQPGKPDVVIVKSDDYWYLKKPVDIAASAFRVHSILSLSHAKSIASYKIDLVDLTELEIDQSPVELQLNNHVIRFGGIDPTSQRRYTQINDYVYLLEDYYLPILRQDTGAFIDTRPIPQDMDISSIDLSNISVTRNEKGNWEISPENSRLNNDDIKHWVDRWRNARASDVKYDSFVPDKPVQKISLRTHDNGEIVLQLINSENINGFYRDDKKTAYIFKDGLPKSLLKGPTKNQDKKITATQIRQ